MQTHAAQASLPVLRLPRAAAIAGVIFSILLVVSLSVIRAMVPSQSMIQDAWLNDPAKRSAVGVALRLVPFAGIAFLWFMGVLRSRLGKLEDQFFATVFLGSGLMFVGSLFAATAISGALLEEIIAGGQLPDAATYDVVRRASYALINVFAIKMAAVFMFSTCTIALRTGILPRAISFMGFACGLILLAVIANWAWIALVFPSWMLLVSMYILIADFRKRKAAPDRLPEYTAHGH